MPHFMHVVLCKYVCLFNPLSLPVPTTPPTEVKIMLEKVTSISFIFTWCPPPMETTNGPITAYILEYGEIGNDSPPHSISLSGQVEEHTVTGLKPHTQYYVKVAAESAAGRGPFCEPVSVQTAPDSECWLCSASHSQWHHRTVLALLETLAN